MWSVTGWRSASSFVLASRSAPVWKSHPFADNLDQGRAANRASVSFHRHGSAAQRPWRRCHGCAGRRRRGSVRRRPYWTATTDDCFAHSQYRLGGYWNCLAAQQQLQVLMKSQSWRKSWWTGSKLVKVGELPASELLRAKPTGRIGAAARIVGGLALLADATGRGADHQGWPWRKCAPAPGPSRRFSRSR